MFFVRHRLLAGLLGVASLGVAARLPATVINYEPNNTKSTSTVLPGGTFTVNSSLDPIIPQTILAQFDPAYSMAPVPGPAGNGTVIEWDNVPMKDPYGPPGDDGTGSVYLSVSGVGDTNFTGSHLQSGKFTYEFRVHPIAQPMVIITDTLTLSPGSVKNIWIDPTPAYIGATVDVIITNLVTKGDTDFYTFSGLQPFQAFTANMSGQTFLPRMGVWYDATTFTSAVDGSILTGHANNLGQVLIGVTAQGDTGFTGAQTASGNYSLVVTPGPIPSPEPGSVVLLGLGGSLALWFRRHQRAKRPPPGSGTLC